MGDDAALDGSDAWLGADGQEGASRHCLELLLANRNKQVPRLAEEARKLVEGGDVDLAITPLAPDDLVLVGALERIASRREEEAAAMLEAWHFLQSGSDRTRLIHSQLVARRAVKVLRAKELGQTHDLLKKAVAVFQAREPVQTP
jgi:hypothetical protein